MRFNSLEYALFLPLAVAAYYAVPKRHRWAILVASGTAALSLLSPVHATIALGFTVVNFGSGRLLEKWADSPKASWTLLLVILFDVGVLGWFKYGRVLMQRSIFLPIGISYYAFQCIGN